VSTHCLALFSPSTRHFSVAAFFPLGGGSQSGALSRSLTSASAPRRTCAHRWTRPSQSRNGTSIRGRKPASFLCRGFSYRRRSLGPSEDMPRVRRALLTTWPYPAGPSKLRLFAIGARAISTAPATAPTLALMPVNAAAHALRAWKRKTRARIVAYKGRPLHFALCPSADAFRGCAPDPRLRDGLAGSQTAARRSPDRVSAPPASPRRRSYLSIHISLLINSFGDYVPRN
jgi:hypothetical protein